jgi:ElaB/YqjD/DUF883 family membrane-anchored ribosome-binding protein
MSFMILLIILTLCLAGIGYIIYKLNKKDKNRVVPIEHTKEYKEADAKVTKGVLDLHTATTHQELRMSLQHVEDGLSFFQDNSLEFDGKTPQEIVELLTKHSESKLVKMYEDLENELQALDEEDKDKLMSLNGSNIDEYKEFKKDSEARKKELREKIIKENEREKVLNELLKRDEEYFEQKKLEKIREQLLSEIKPPKENNETN